MQTSEHHPAHSSEPTRSRTSVHAVASGLAIMHAAVWYAWRPTEDEISAAGFTLLSSLKLPLLAAVLWQLRRVHVLLGQRRVSPMRAVAGWTLGLMATLTLLTPLRESIAPMFETAQTHLVRPSEEIGYSYPFLDSVSDEQRRHRHFVVQWNRGEILAIEALLAALIAGAHVTTIRAFGPSAGTGSVLLAGLVSFAACWSFGYIFGLVLLTYDTFYLGAMAGPLALDFVTPTALYPTTPLAAPFYVTLSLSSWIIAAGSRAPASNGVVCAPLCQRA